MPITKEALIAGLTAGVKSYNTDTLEFTNFGSNLAKTHDLLLVQVFGNAVITAQNLQDVSGVNGSVANASFSTPAEIAGTPPIVKSYLDAPVVAPISTTGNVGKIAFALVSSSYAIAQSVPRNIAAANETEFSLGSGNNATTIPDYTENVADPRGDIFMVITVDPAIAVTAGGYLTVKGYASGVVGSDSFTYVTLQSGS